MNDLMHWHGRPSELVEPAPCCVEAFDKQLARRVDLAAHDERRRIILDAVKAIMAYSDAATSVLAEPEAELVRTVTAKAIDAINKTGCICPSIETTTIGGPTKYTRGYDHRCGMHDPRPSTKESG